MTKKIIPFEISLKSTKRAGFTFQPRPQILTNDANAAELNFIITDTSAEELAGSTATVLLFMKDGSFFQNTDVTRVNNTFVYTIKPNQAKHKGVAQAQLVIKIGTVENASPLMEFEIIGGLETKPIVEREIQDWTSLTAEAKAFVDQIEGFTLESFVENKMGEELANLEVNYAGRLTGLEQKDNQITAQLAQTYEQTRMLENKKADNARIDEILTTQAEGISEQEIIDARKGQPSLRAKTDQVDDQLLSHEYEFNDLFGGERLVSPHLQWEQGSIQSVGGDLVAGALVDSDNRIRSDFKQTDPNRETVFKIKVGYEFWLVEYDAGGVIKNKPVDYRTELNFIPDESTQFIRLVVRRFGTPTSSSNTADRITPVDIHDTNIIMRPKTEHALPAISEATDDIQKVNTYTTLTSSNNLIELDMHSNRNFEVDVKDATTKHIIFRNLHKIKDNLISRVLKINLHSGASIELPENIKWQSESPFELLDGYTHLILFQSFDGGTSWSGAVTSWKISNRVVFDDFNRPNRLGLGSALTGQPWQYTPTSIWEIDNGKAKVRTFRSDNDILSSDMAYVESGVANAKVTAVVEELNSAAIRIIVRLKDNHNYILIGRLRALGDENTDYIGIFEMNNGTQTLLQTSPTTATFKNGDTLAAELDGSSIRAFHNGVLACSATSTFNQTETKHGIVSLKDKETHFYTFLVEAI